MVDPKHKIRIDGEGDIYEWVSRGRYRKAEPPPAPPAVPILPGEIMLEVGEGLFARTHRCVVEVACPHCHAPIGKLCGHPGRPSCGTHYRRRDAAMEKRRADALARSDS